MTSYLLLALYVWIKVVSDTVYISADKYDEDRKKALIEYDMIAHWDSWPQAWFHSEYRNWVQE